MEKIEIEGTAKTPQINLDSTIGIFEISGRSIPENSIEFYTPIYNWLDKYLELIKINVTFNFKLEYFNTSSSKCLLDIFKKLEKFHHNGNTIQIVWYYEEDDEDMQEAGEDYQRIVNVPIKFEKVTEF